MTLSSNAPDRIERCARIVLLRALGFTALGIGTLLLGLSGNPALALTTGAILTAITGLVLVCKRHTALTRDYRRTELWLLLDRRHDLREDRAQQILGGTLSMLYGRAAEYVLVIAAVQWLLSVAARLI